VLGIFVIRAGAASITNTSCADTSLLEIEPSHNNGGQAFTISGHLQNPFLTRALYRFDLAGIPTNALIQSVVLQLTVTAQPGDGLEPSAFGLHRMLRPWGEGNKVALAHPGQGEPATAGEATWSHSFYPTNAWTLPGGAPDVDFVSGESSYQDITFAVESYRFGSTPELVDDAQGWVNDPQSNFGWILISDKEGTPFTARHFGSREDPDALPALEIDYLVPPRIDSARPLGNQFELQFTAEAGQTYVVEYRTALTNGIWQTLTNLGLVTVTSPVPVQVHDNLSQPHRFYRLNSY